MKNLLILFSLLWVMSQSVNVLSCECPNCPENDKENTICAVYVPICKDCKAEKMGATFIKQSVTVDKQERMLADDDISSCYFNLLECYPHFKDTFSECDRTLKPQEAQGQTRSLEYYIGYKCMDQGKWLNIIICYAACLSYDGKSLHLTIQSCESSDANRELEVTFNEGKTAINIPVTSPEIMINMHLT